MEEREKCNDREAEANEVGLNHVHCDACLQQELNKSHNVEDQEEEAEALAVVSANKTQVYLTNDHADSDHLQSDVSVLVEGILTPALHGESLNHTEGNLVVVLRESKSTVGVSNQGNDHTDQVEVIAAHKGNQSTECEHEWRDVNLDGIEVAHVCHVEIAEHADESVGEDDEGQALVVALLVLEQLHGQSRQREEEHDEDHRHGGDGLVHLLHIVEHVELPASEEHLLSHLIFHDDIWQSVVE